MIPESLQLWLLMAVLITGVLLYMLMPLIRPRRDVEDTTREVYDINVYKDQLQEVERDLERGLLGETGAEATRTEIKRRLLAADAVVTKSAAGAQAKSGLILVAVLAIFVPVGALFTYLTLGSPNASDQPLASRAPALDPAEVERRENLTAAMAKLMEKLQANPNDVRGWSLLGRSYASLEQYAKSAEAYGRAYEQSGGDAQIGVDYAEALAFEARTVVPPKAVSVLQAVLIREPNEPKAHYYLALSKAQNGDGAGAMQGWVKLVEMSPSDAPWLSLVNQQITRAAEQFDLDPASFRSAGAKPSFPQSMPVAKQPPGPSRADMDAAATMTDDDRQQMIRSMVARLAARLQNEPGDKEGWQRLENAYRVLGETAKADAAAAKAAALP
ncbi:MAG: c-type cytochrome biogenesis protein CcmI [Alphaproteobacteria bacterium]